MRNFDKSILNKFFLKETIEGAFMTFSGNAFHGFTIRTPKKYLRTSLITACFSNLRL